jgi:hypothetical protein
MAEDSADDGQSRFEDHVDEFADFFDDPQELGRKPDDLIDVLAHIAMAGPAVTVARALLRCLHVGDDQASPAVQAASAKVGLGFRTLFNQPESIELISGLYRSGAYWRKVLRYCFDGNLQSVMDEYIHILIESLGLQGHETFESALKIGDTISTALSIRSPTLRFDEFQVGSDGVRIEKHGIRCRYALRFGDERTWEVEGRTRDEDVRIAFNSPFRPFTLATTSIGQEGLDFHQYCHRVVHWNLPSNPVDLEQREGRVHRYKGHVIRRNLAKEYGIHFDLLQQHGALLDPWAALFHIAEAERLRDSNDLVPYWIFDTKEGFKIERVVPMLPFSREESQLESLHDHVVAYRSVMGQPRQDELLGFLAHNKSLEEIRELVSGLSIDLSPPSSSHMAGELGGGSDSVPKDE